MSNFFIKLVFLILLPYNLIASEMPIHFTDAQWDTGVKTDHSEMSVDITVQQDDFGDHYFYAHTIYLDGKNTENNEPNIMYAGFQNKGWSGEEWVGCLLYTSDAADE